MTGPKQPIGERIDTALNLSRWPWCGICQAPKAKGECGHPIFTDYYVIANRNVPIVNLAEPHDAGRRG